MKRFTLLALTSLLVIGFAFPITASAAPPTNAALNDIPVSGTDSAGDAFNGTLDITEITRDGSRLLFDGTLTNSATGAVTTFENVAGTLQANGSGAACDILFLDLGPIFLDLLGLQIDLSPIVLDIDAVPGAGNLLGNLLCALVGLLDGGLFDGGLASLLDRLLARINDILG